MFIGKNKNDRLKLEVLNPLVSVSMYFFFLETGS